MTARSYADELDAAAVKIGDVPRHELAVMLRHAALGLRHAVPAMVAMAILAGCQTYAERPTEAYDCVVTPHDLVECNPVEDEADGPS